MAWGRKSQGTTVEKTIGTDVAPMEERIAPPVAISRPRGFASWSLGGLFGNSQFVNPYNRVPLSQNYALYKAMREAIPVIDAALGRLKMLVGCPEVKAANDETRDQISTWLNNLPVNRIQVGWYNWLNTWLDSMLCYGRSHTEIILDRPQKRVFALMPLHPKTIFLRPSPDLYSMDIVQQQAGQPVLLNPLLMLNGVHDVRDDDPNGTSVLWGMSLTSEILTGMMKALGGTWQRFGNPRYHVNWEPPEEWPDSEGEKSQVIVDRIAGQFEESLASGVEGDIRDFFSSGKVTVTVIGANGEALVFEGSSRALVEQIVSKTGIPPFLLGLQWATTERMSAVQAALLTQLVMQIRAEITSELVYLIDLNQKLSGGDREFKLHWPPPTLMDEFETARADLLAEQARKARIENEQGIWRLGMENEYDVFRALRPELSDMTDPEILARYPLIAHVAPAAPAPTPFGGGGAGGNQPGGGNPFGNLLMAIDAYDRNPFARERTRMLTNGNGKH